MQLAQDSLSCKHILYVACEVLGVNITSYDYTFFQQSFIPTLTYMYNVYAVIHKFMYCYILHNIKNTFTYTCLSREM